jgi:hypothetical protein
MRGMARSRGFCQAVLNAWGDAARLADGELRVAGRCPTDAPWLRSAASAHALPCVLCCGPRCPAEQVELASFFPSCLAALTGLQTLRLPVGVYCESSAELGQLAALSVSGVAGEQMALVDLADGAGVGG